MGGAFLLIANVLFMVGVTINLLWVPVAPYGSDGAARAQLIVDNGTQIQGTAWLYLVADVFVLAAAWFLIRRELTGRIGFNASAFWVFVAAGAMTGFLRYFILASALVPAAAAYDTTPAVFNVLGALLRAINVIFIGSIMAASALIYLGEARARNAVLPQWLAYTGLAISIVRFVQPFAAWAPGSEAAANFATFLFYLGFYVGAPVSAYFGWGIARNSVGLASPSVRATAARA